MRDTYKAYTIKVYILFLVGDTTLSASWT